MQQFNSYVKMTLVEIVSVLLVFPELLSSGNRRKKECATAFKVSDQLI